jgi:hypothetical protein
VNPINSILIRLLSSCWVARICPPAPCPNEMLKLQDNAAKFSSRFWAGFRSRFDGWSNTNEALRKILGNPSEDSVATIVDQPNSAESQPVESCKQNPEQVMCKYGHLIDSTKYPAQRMLQPVFAHYLEYQMYCGEYFAMQVDSQIILQSWCSTKSYINCNCFNHVEYVSTRLCSISCFRTIVLMMRCNQMWCRVVPCITDNQYEQNFLLYRQYQ